MQAPSCHRFPAALAVPAIVFLVIGLALLLGGIRLAMLGGSWYYVVAGVGIAATAILLWMRRRSALLLFARILFASVIWAVVEARFDFWQLLPRLWLWLVLGLWLLLPAVTRKLVFGPPSTLRECIVPLTAAIVLTVLLGLVTPFNHPYNHAGEIQMSSAKPAATALAGEANRQAGDWTDYGGSQLGQRYSPLAQITPANAAQLKMAWRYETGDKPGPGDPTEITDENTPIKVDNKLFLCTPHSIVIALDPASGKQIWRYHARIQSPVGFKNWAHMTCRGVSYHDDGLYRAPLAAAAAASSAAGAASASEASDTSASGNASSDAASSAPIESGSTLAASGSDTATASATLPTAQQSGNRGSATAASA
jgi:quinoprotein glucose dehydrogenase